MIKMHTYTFPSKLVRFFTRYTYTHVGIAFEPMCNEIYSFGRISVEHAFIGGFTVEHRDGEFFKIFGKSRAAVYEIDVTDEQYDKVVEIVDEMVANKDKYLYDFLGVFPRFFGIPFKRSNRFVCSSFVGHVFSEAGIWDFNKPICMVKPRDFISVPSRLIYEGLYTQMIPAALKVRATECTDFMS